MFSKGIKFIAFTLIAISQISSVLSQHYDINEYYERKPISPQLANKRALQSGYLESAVNFIDSPAGKLTMSMAKEAISRSYGGNQVLSLNATSLLILVLLKGLIFATALLGGANWNQYGRAAREANVGGDSK